MQVLKTHVLSRFISFVCGHRRSSNYRARSNGERDETQSNSREWNNSKKEKTIRPRWMCVCVVRSDFQCCITTTSTTQQNHMLDLWCFFFFVLQNKLIYIFARIVKWVSDRPFDSRRYIREFSVFKASVWCLLFVFSFLYTFRIRVSVFWVPYHLTVNQWERIEFEKNRGRKKGTRRTSEWKIK